MPFPSTYYDRATVVFRWVQVSYRYQARHLREQCHSHHATPDAPDRCTTHCQNRLVEVHEPAWDSYAFTVGDDDGAYQVEQIIHKIGSREIRVAHLDGSYEILTGWQQMRSRPAV